jgi:hypothetical protein
MEWIILVVLVPAVIVPVVLLFGFAGCAALADIEDINLSQLTPGKPYNLYAEAIGEFEILVTWQFDSKGPAGFEIERTGGTGGPQKFTGGGGLGASTGIALAGSFLATGLESDEWYAFEVVVVGAVDASKRSDPASTSPVKTWKWESVLPPDFSFKDPVADPTVVEPLTDTCLVQRIPKQLIRVGKGIRFTLRANTPLTILRASISRAPEYQGDVSAVEPWDSDPVDMQKNKISGPLSVVPPNTTPLTWKRDVWAGADLVVAFDISSGDGLRSTEPKAAAFASYIKHGAQEAATANRAGPASAWDNNNNKPRLVLIEKIEILFTT